MSTPPSSGRPPGTAGNEPGTGAAGADRDAPPRARVPAAGSAIAAVATALLAVAAFAPGLLAPGDPTAIDLSVPLGRPSWEHWFGTDEIGRDLYTRIVHGTAQSLAIGFGAAGVALVLAVALALIATLAPPLAAGASNRVVEILFAFPTLLLALLLVSVLSPSPRTLVLAVGVGVAPGYARMVRAQLLAVRDSPYVEAATTLGHPRYRIVARHVLPNALRPLVAVFALSVGQCVVWSSSLSFLGLGVAPPASEWGALLEAGRAYVSVAGWLIVLPGMAIVLLAVTATTVGRVLRIRLEPGA